MAGGQPSPPRLLEAFAINAPDCSAAAPVAGGKTAPFPEASQIAVTGGAASLNDGFVPLNMTDPSIGGIPPFGVDMNGILYLLSSWIAYLAAGQLPIYDAALSTEMGGYALGAKLQQTANPLATWTSAVAGNTTDPDTGGAGWISSASAPLFNSSAPSAGTMNNVALPGPSDYIYDIDTTAGNLTITGFVGQRDGQILYISNIGANQLTLSALSGSSAANQFRLPSDLNCVQNQTVTFIYSTDAEQWVLI